MIKFEDVSFAFPKQEVLQHLDFSMEDGEFIGILGPNGGGKTTFLKLALKLLKPQSGHVLINERKIAYIAQTTSMNDNSFPATVEEVVASGLVDGRIKPFLRKEEKKQITDLLNDMDLLPLRKRLVTELSGGQAQRVKVAKALISNPSLVVLDEPDAGMDEESHEHLLSTIHLVHQKGIGILFVSHHPHDLEEADHIYFIEDGQILTYQEELERGHHHAEL